MKRWGGAAVGYAGLRRPVELLDGMRVEDVFTSAERVRSSGRTLDHWAGRLAGKRAVLRLLGLPPTATHLGQVEILPLPTPACQAGATCLDGHPPAVHLHADLARRTDPRGIRVSISHTGSHALAVALSSPHLPEDDRRVVRGSTERGGAEEDRRGGVVEGVVPFSSRLLEWGGARG
ncbi:MULTISPECIES: phosphopantetheinyl transferase [Nonomuraea]|uniref:Phosphopantetheinyl transferase n=1 Tax=Nonomuraea ferruginea TaxID=46174 RepID=A0ABT4TA77_9ACTN|nr:phosphopantetheinyl transferase [Nonomuraea ferruginea]MDA0646407.1 phosphopantetheinyl transferase [Nonomuraea ferruginea]